jgi:small ligand-binding sensory domain FIST
MRAQATSFVARGESPIRVAKAAADAVRAVERPSGGLVFVSGDLLSDIGGLAARLKTALPELPLLVVGGHGVLTERGEIERETAVSGIVWRGGQSTALTVTSEGDVGSALAAALEPLTGRSSTAFVFASPRGSQPHTIEPLRALEFRALFGGGTAGDRQVVALMPGREPVLGTAGALVASNLHGPVIASSPACRLLMPLGRITRARGPMVLEIEGRPALEVLSSSAKHLRDQPLVLAALASEGIEAEERPALLVRGIQGVDPARQGVIVADEIQDGMRLAFAVRDAAAARADLEAALQRLSRDTAGALPSFGVFLSCAGRGNSLYGQPDVDVRLVRARFPEIPMAGMHSSFEIAPHDGAATLQLYTGVLSIFTAPS